MLPTPSSIPPHNPYATRQFYVNLGTLIRSVTVYPSEHVKPLICRKFNAYRTVHSRGVGRRCSAVIDRSARTNRIDHRILTLHLRGANLHIENAKIKAYRLRRACAASAAWLCIEYIFLAQIKHSRRNVCSSYCVGGLAGRTRKERSDVAIIFPSAYGFRASYRCPLP